jgi:hypothetical protein
MGDSHCILDSAYSLREEMVRTNRAIHLNNLHQDDCAIHVQVASKCSVITVVNGVVG